MNTLGLYRSRVTLGVTRQRSPQAEVQEAKSRQVNPKFASNRMYFWTQQMVLTTILQWIRVLHQAIVSPMFVVLRAALGLQVKSQTIEDEFHQAKLEDAKRYGAGERTPTSRFVMPSLKDYEQYFRNLDSRRTDQVVEWIAVASPRFKGIETVADVLAGKHDAMRVRGDPDRLLVELDADHRYLGGSMFLRCIESMLGTPPRKLPPSSPLYGLLCAVRTLPHTLRFMRKRRRLECPSSIATVKSDASTTCDSSSDNADRHPRSGRLPK